MKDGFKSSANPENDEYPEYSPKYDVDYTIKLDDQTINGETYFLLKAIEVKKFSRRYNKIDKTGMSYDDCEKLALKIRDQIRAEAINQALLSHYENEYGADEKRKQRKHYHHVYKPCTYPRKKPADSQLDCE